MADLARSDWTKAPPWFQLALHEIGIKETPGAKSTARVVEYRKIAGTLSEADDGDLPWCAIFVNAMLKLSGYETTGSMAARSFETHKAFSKLPKPLLGCIVTFWRKTPRSGLGHVGLYRGETATHIYSLGGNQGDQVSIAPFRKAGPSFGFSGFYYPNAGEINGRQIGPIPIRAGLPLKDASVV